MFASTSVRILCLASMFTLASCSSNGSDEAVSTSMAVSETTVAESTTTSAASTSTTTTTQPEPASNCTGTEDDLSAAVGEPLGFFICDGDWASYMTKEYADTCENCESISIARWSDGAWVEVGDFNQYFSLSPADLDGEISKESLCAIWSTNRSSQFISETGCTPDS